MSYYTYDPWWEEKKDELDEEELSFMQGYDAGYAEGSEFRETLASLEQQNEALRGLCAANVRVIKAEILKEIEEEKNITKEQDSK